MRRRGGFDKGFFLLLLIVLILAATGVFLYEQIRTDKISETIKRGQPIVFALFVTDKSGSVKWRDVQAGPEQAPDGAGDSGPDGPSDASGSAQTQTTTNGGAAAGASTQAAANGSQNAPAASGSDTLFFTEVVMLDAQTKRAAVIDIPGNVGSLIDAEKKIDRIDVLFHPGGVDAYRSKLSDLLGIDVPFYLEIDVKNIAKLVDLLGGISLFIPNPVEQTQTQPFVLLPSGSMTLDGAKVESYLTYKDATDTDIEVIGRRQKFVQSLLKSLGSNDTLISRPGVYALFRGWVSTNLNKRSLMSLVDATAKLDVDRIVFQRVLGVDRTVDGETLLFPHYDGRLLHETVQQTVQSLANPQSEVDQTLNEKLQVLNGTSVGGLAHRTSEVFQSFGYDVVAVGNADRQDYDHTTIIDHDGDMAGAQRVASIIKCSLIDSKPAPAAAPAADAEPAASDQSFDVTIILGKDFDGRYCK